MNAFGCNKVGLYCKRPGKKAYVHGLVEIFSIHKLLTTSTIWCRLLLCPCVLIVVLVQRGST